MSRLASIATDDARLGKLFSGIAYAGLGAAAVVAILGTILVLTGTSAMDRSLAVTADAVVAADDTVALAADTIEIVGDSLATLVESAGLVAGAFDEASTVIADLTTLVTVEVPDALDAVLAAMPAIESSARIIDNTLSVLSLVGVDYDPEVPFDEAVAELETALTPLPGELRAQAGALGGLAADFREFGTASEAIAGDLAALQAQLDEAVRLLDTYADATSDATEVVADIRGDLVWQRWLMVAAVLILSAAIGALMIVPLALGRRFADA